jgi:hypothetical protein
MVGSIPCIQIRSNCLIGYELAIYDSRSGTTKNEILLQQLKEAKKRAYGGKLTQGAKKRMTRAIDLLVQSSKKTWGKNEVTGKRTSHTLSFITLTISNNNNLTGRQGFDLIFSHFLQWMRRTAKVTTYIWKAEVQERGQLHYHITTPSWIHYQKIRQKWNSLQQAAGITNDYYSEHGHYDPNSTDIKEVRMVNDLAGYMKKEFCKSIQNPYVQREEKINERLVTNQITKEQQEQQLKELSIEMKGWGKLWDCSKNLKAEKYYTIEESHDTHQRINELEKKGFLTMQQLEQCTLIRIKGNQNTTILNLREIQQYDQMITRIRNYRTDSEIVKPLLKTLPPQTKRIPLLDNYNVTIRWQPSQLEIVF